MRAPTVGPVPGLAEHVELKEGTHVRLWISARVVMHERTKNGERVEPVTHLQVLDWDQECRHCHKPV